MISNRSCDICHAPLGAETTRLESVRGLVRFLPRDRWTVQPAPSGIRVQQLCKPCDAYLREALEHLRVELRRNAAASPAAATAREQLPLDRVPGAGEVRAAS